MIKYPKIQTVYLRDSASRYKTLLEGMFAMPEFAYLAGNEWEWQEKVDGTNIRVQWGLGDEISVPPVHQVTFRGRTDMVQIPSFLLAKLQEMFPVDKFIHLPIMMTLYGEGYGAKIQKGGGNYIPDGVSFILFDVRVDDLWLKREDVRGIALRLGISSVPIIGHGTLREAVELARVGFQSRIGTQLAEGLVMRPMAELLTRRGQRIIAKIKRKDFL